MSGQPTLGELVADIKPILPENFKPIKLIIRATCPDSPREVIILKYQGASLIGDTLCVTFEGGDIERLEQDFSDEHS